MSAIALITTSPFYGLEQMVEVTIPSLKSQTCQDFTWYYLDGFYLKNKRFFVELQDKVSFKIVHTPLLHATHYPHNFKWEPYNSALLLIKEPLFLRFGRFRNYHPRSVEIVLNELSLDNIFVNFHQYTIDGKTNYDEGFTDSIRTHIGSGFDSSCGMFAGSTEYFINNTNGNDEVGLHWFHFEDVEMNCRINIDCFTLTLENALIRYNHCKDWLAQPALDQPVIEPDNSQGSLFNVRYNVDPWLEEMRLAFSTNNKVRKIDIGFDFWHSSIDNSLIPGSGNGYRDWVNDSYNSSKSIIGLGGMMFGRNIAKMKDKISSIISTDDRIKFITESYLEKDYYV